MGMEYAFYKKGAFRESQYGTEKLAILFGSGK